MIGCDSARRLVSAYLDGELEGEDRAAFEAHVLDCAACRQSLDHEREVVRAIRESLPLYEAPLELRERVGRLARDQPPASIASTGRPGLAFGHPLVLAASLAAFVLAATAVLRDNGGTSSRERSRPAGAFAALAVDTHLRHERDQLPLEVRSEDTAVVSRFFEGRVPFHLTLPDYPVTPGESKPYRLEGGRLVSFGGDYAAYVAYRMDDRPISLLVTSAERVRPEGGERLVSGGLTFHMESVAGLKVITWTDKGLTYALASDLAVTGNRSCIICHGSAEERRKFEGL